MRFGTWNVRSLYSSGSRTAVTRELARYKLDVVGVWEVRWDKRSTVRAGDYNCFLWKKKRNNQLGTGFFYTTE
jgi:exonuclease III